MLEVIVFLLLLVWSPLSHCHDFQSDACQRCTDASRVWCAETRVCVDRSTDCDDYIVNWFEEQAVCNNKIVISPDLCPQYDVEYDERFITASVTGNMIAIPIQPRFLVYDVLNKSDDHYILGGYFSHVPSKSEQKPQFFFFSEAVGTFIHHTFRPYESKDYDDYTPENVTSIFQTLDLTVVGNSALKYNMSFVVARKNGDTFDCAYTQPSTFVQRPVYQDFVITLCAAGLGLWFGGIFVMVNFMMWFESKGIFMNEKPHESVLVATSPPLSNSIRDSKTYSNIASNSNESITPPPSMRGGLLKRYWRQWKHEWTKFVKSMGASDQDILSKRGVTVYHYLLFHRLAILLVLACSLVSLILGLTAYLNYGTQRDLIAGDFATTTVASLKLTSYSNLTWFFIIIINTVFCAVFIWILRLYSFTVVLTDDSELLPVSAFTVEISEIPEEVTDDALLWEHFTHVYGPDMIVNAHVVPFMRKALLLMEEKLECEEALASYELQAKETGKKPFVYKSVLDYVWGKDKVDAVELMQEKIEELDKLIEAEKEKPKIGSGYGYVTFKDPEEAKKCLRYFNHSELYRAWKHLKNMFCCGTHVIYKHSPHNKAPHAIKLNAFNWRVGQALLPQEIIWKNLGISTRKTYFVRFLIGILEAIVFVAILSFTVGFAIFEVYRDLRLSSIFYNFGGNTLWATILGNLSVVLPEAIAIVDELVAPIVERLEYKAYHKHLSGWRRTVMWNITFFEMLGGLVLSRMVYFGIGVAVLYNSSAPFNTYHYLFNKIGMDMMKYICIKTFTVYGIKLAAIGFIKWLEHFVHRKIERPEFDFYDMFAQKIVVLFCILVYGSVMPLILPLGIMYLAVSWMIDKWVILTYYNKEPISDPKLLFYAADVASLYFAVVPVVTLICTLKIFSELPVIPVLLFGFSVLALVWFHQSRRWQNLNQNVKGKRRVVRAKPRSSTRGVDKWRNAFKRAAESMQVKEVAGLAKNEFWKIAASLKDGGQKMQTEFINITIDDEDTFRNAYKHPLV